ncbi:uncharacterized protein [Antedon mediterranea]|uniref:uncharacterized protein n=1 Tax=Antedon mediterranea TaxID=105859 RepID=UPI003AF64384
MDDCDLEKLSVKPGTLSPKFARNTTEYSVTVPSDVAQITISCLTSDSNASYQIIGSEGSKTLPLKEDDVTVLKIEVSAEDGTTKFYKINVKRLSAKDATLSSITLSIGQLTPDFSTTVTNYTSIVPCSLSMLSVKAKAPDKKTSVTVNGESSAESEVGLNVGDTTIEIKVTSIDGSNTQIYVINIIRKWLPAIVNFEDPPIAMKYECPVTLGPLYRPISIKESDPKHVFSEPIIELLTRTSKIDPLDETPLDGDWKLVEEKMDTELSAINVKCIYSYLGCTAKMEYSELGNHIKNCHLKPITGENDEIEKETCSSCSHKVTKSEMDWHNANLCTGKFTNREIKHSYKEHQWEKSLQEVVGGGNVDDLLQNAKTMIKNYRNSLPKPGQTVRDANIPIDHLHNATVSIACAIRKKPKDAELHFKLGLLMEEKYYAEDMYGLKKEEDVADDFGSLTLNAKETGKEEEIGRICQQRGVDPKAPLSRVLQAIDEEYKFLLESGQSGKADYVQGLYIWKSKQATKDGKAAQAAADQQNPLGQAFLKFQDALSLDQNNALYNVHVGRLLLMQDKPDEAIKRLELAVGLKPQFTIARFYLGLSIMEHKSDSGSRAKEAVTYLHEGLEKFLELSLANADNIGCGDPEFDLNSEDLWRATTVALFKGFLHLASIQDKLPKEKSMGAKQIFHCCSTLAARNLCNLSARANTYQSMEWILLDCHSNLLNLMLTNESSKTKWIAKRCQQLSAFIRCSTLPKNQELMNLQTKTCQTGVIIQPTNSQALCLLGNAQLAFYDNQPSSVESKTSLQQAQLSFRASIAQEGQPIAGGDIPKQLKDQEWWKLKEKEKEEKAAAVTAKTKPATRGGLASRGGVTKPVGRGRGATASKVTPTSGTKVTPVRGAAAANRGKPAPAKAALPNKSTAAKAATRGTVTKTTANRGGPAKGSATAISKQQATDKKEEPMPASTVPANTPLNRISYQPRLGLARVLAKENEDSEESHMLYNDIIIMAPQLHDAYIELADLLIKKDQMKAVDVYSRFPFPESSSFDDAYIHGEIVRILMKNQKFDDPRLEPHLIAWGRVMGIGCLEKYVEILESKFKNELLKNVYAGVNYKDVNDPDLQAFFKFKMWL